MIDFEIYPHFTEGILPEIQKLFEKKGAMYLLKDGQAIGIRNSTITEYGGKILKY